MLNPYFSSIAKVKDIKTEAPEVKLFTLGFLNKEEQEEFDFLPGQIVELGLSGVGEAPFAICSCGIGQKYFQVCVRKVGRLTNKIHELKIGDTVTIRGPYGLGVFPKTQRNLLLVAGGLGLIPLRSLIQRKIRKFKKSMPKIQLFYGIKTQKDMIFKDEYKEWSKYIDMHITLDEKEKGWKGHTGLITTLFKDVKLIENPVAILCGPPIMYKFVILELAKAGFKDEDIYISLERRIHCGIGLCQHCAIGSKYVCKDGPVFRYNEIKNIKGTI